MPKTRLHDVLTDLAAREEPASYLEIGVREGESLACVLPLPSLRKVVLCDTWGDSFGGTGRGSHEHLLGMLAPYELEVVWWDGDSKTMVPREGPKHRNLDLALIDGDHSIPGASRDLIEVWPLVRPGGVLVFDDVAHPAHPGLEDLFLKTVRRWGSKVQEFHVDRTRPHGVAWARKSLDG